MMWSTRIAARTLVAGLTAAGVLAGAAGVAVASAAIPTCTVTQFKLIAVGTRGTELGMASATTLCFGTYVFTGVLPSKLGSAAVTTDNYAELAAVLKHWNSIDGVPAVSEWVNLSPTVAAGMKAAGINPTMFLQWVNEYDGAGTVYHPAMPPTWPPFLPKALVSDPATIVGGTADQAVTAPKATPPPQAAPQQPVTPTQAPKPPAESASAAGATSGGTVAVSQPASSTTSAAESATKTTTAKSPKTVAGPTVTPVAPPAAVTAGPVTVPCVVATACRQAVVARDRWLSTPWYRRAGLQIWWHRWWEITALVIVAVATLGARAVIIGRRNLAWYGNVRGPR